MIKIAPSILSADFANLSVEIQKLEEAKADMIHIDVMDGNFVPNLTFGPPLITDLRKHTKLPFDVHLMINNPEGSIVQYAKAGANYITIHPESTIHLDKTINLIKDLGKKAGIALLPTTHPSILQYIIDKIDLVLVMCVNPGFGGQKFMDNQLPKIRHVADLVGKKNILVAVDGGIDEQKAKLCREQKANLLVSGNFIFSGDYKKNIALLR